MWAVEGGAAGDGSGGRGPTVQAAWSPQPLVGLGAAVGSASFNNSCHPFLSCRAGRSRGCGAQGALARHAAPAAEARARHWGGAGEQARLFEPPAAAAASVEVLCSAGTWTWPSKILLLHTPAASLHPRRAFPVLPDGPPAVPTASVPMAPLTDPQVSFVELPEFDFDLTLGGSTNVPLEPALKSWIKQ